MQYSISIQPIQMDSDYTQKIMILGLVSLF